MKLNPFHKIFDLKDLLDKRAEWKEMGEKVVFTNGVFDLIHPGHIVYLKEAKELGTKLILGLNSDVSAKTLGKGPSRPINNEQDRAVVLSAFEMIDAVVLFDEETPQELITQLLPDVLVKGGDYSVETIVGAKEVLAIGGEVKSLQFLPGYSTTSIEQKIVQSSLENKE